MTIPIFYAVDNHYAPYLAVSLQSLMANADPSNTYQIIIMAEDLSKANRVKLQSLVTTSRFHLTFKQINPALLTEITDTDNKLRMDYFTFTIYFRLFIADLFPQYDKAVYLDADTVVLDDISHLYSTPIGDNLIAAATDPTIAGKPVTAAYATNAIGVAADHYINSGVLVMNLHALRAIQFSSVFLNLLNTYHVTCLAPDQDYLNAMCQQRTALLDPSWNVQMETRPSTHQSLIHFNLFAKPWHYTNVANESYFWNYAKQTPYYAEMRTSLLTYSETARAADKINFQRILRVAETQATATNTFRQIRDQNREEVVI